MATTTTFETIRDNIISDIKGIAPTYLAGDKFDHCPRRYYLREYTEKAGASGALRKFEILRVGTTEQLPHLDPTAIMRRESLRITVAYPRQVAIYGTDDLLDMEKIIRADARQIRDVINSTGNIVSGQHEQFADIEEPEREENYTYQSLLVSLIYLEAQSLT